MRVCLTDTPVNHATTAEPIEMLLDGYTRVGPLNYVLDLDRVHVSAIWRIRWNDLCGGGDMGCHYHHYSNLSSVTPPTAYCIALTLSPFLPSLGVLNLSIHIIVTSAN